MDAHNLNKTTTESVTKGANTHTAPKMTKDEAQQMSYEALLKLMKDATGHTGKDFSTYMNCDFAYDELITILKNRDLPKMSKEAAQSLPDEKLLQMIADSAGHTGQDFGVFMGCDFSYSYLASLIRERGFENGWHRTSEGSSPVVMPTVIRMKKSDEGTTRKSFVIDEDIAAEWKDFNKNVPFPSVTLGYALRRFMDDVRAGRIKFELEI